MARTLSDELLARLKERAESPDSRTDFPPGWEARHLAGSFSTVTGEVGSDAPEEQQLPEAATEAEVAAAEAALGLTLPPDLRLLYTEVANGGFGPGGGIASLKEVSAKYASLTSEPAGEGGQEWPRDLLPIGLAEPGADCYELSTGRIVCWDEESLADGDSDEVWAASFKPVAPTLEEWLENWVGRPPAAEVQRQAMEKGVLDELRSSLAYWRGLAPEERAAMGLPETGWEKVLFGHWGVDLDEL